LKTILNSWTLLVVILAIAGCTAMPARQAVDAANVVYTQGASQHMISAKVPVDAASVYNSFLRVISEHPDLSIVTQKDAAMMIEVTRGDFKVTGQVTELDAGRSLLYIWADAGDSGYSGRELSEDAVDLICEELGVSIERVEY